MFTKERILLFTLAAIQFTNIVDFMIVMPLGPHLKRIFDINPQQFGLIVSAYTFSAGISGFLGAFFIDKFDRKTALLSTYIGFTLGTLACALAPTYETLLLARVLTGLFGGILGALVLSVVGDAIPFERRGAAMGTVMASFSLASIFGVPFGLFLATKLGWHAPFLFLVGIALVVAVLIYFYMPHMHAHILKGKPKVNPIKVITQITSNKIQMLALLLMFMLMIGQFTVVPFISNYMVANVGFTEEELTYIYMAGGAFTIFTSPLIGRLADRYGNVRVFTIAIIVSTVPMFLITNMPQIHIAYALMVTSLFFITSGGRMIPATTMITATVNPQNRGSFMSINSSVQQISAAIGSLIGGLIVVQEASGKMLNYQYVGYIAIATSILAIFIARKLRPQGNQHLSVKESEEQEVELQHKKSA
ncbi:MAG: MFS transporter [Bacteroidia bacterium]